MDLSYIIIPVLTLLTSQVLKLLTDGVKGNFDIKNLFSSYGGFPSSHTAFCVSITTLVGLRYGFDDALFAVALVFTLLIMRDAVAFRNYLGLQGRVFNEMIGLLPEFKSKTISFREKMGHSIIEVLGGVAWGIVCAVVLNGIL